MEIFSHPTCRCRRIGLVLFLSKRSELQQFDLAARPVLDLLVNRKFNENVG